MTRLQDCLDIFNRIRRCFVILNNLSPTLSEESPFILVFSSEQFRNVTKMSSTSTSGHKMRHLSRKKPEKTF